MKRLLTIQDISCVGQCSTTVALPLVSACGVECAILPSSVLSNHTGGFKSWTFADLTAELGKVEAKWCELGIKFDAFYTGYVSESHIDPILSIMDSCENPGALRIVDPAMADNGKLYYGFDEAYAAGMADLCRAADLVLPNLTEACFMTGCEYKEKYDYDYILSVLDALEKAGMKNIVLTGVSYDDETTGVLVKIGDKIDYYSHRKIPVGSHGTGDVFASAFSGALLRGNSEIKSAEIAANYTLRCIENTIGDDSHRYGVKFETAIPYLLEQLN